MPNERKTEDAVDDMKSAAELKPILDGVEAIASDVVKARKRTEERLEDQEKQFTRRLDDFEGRVNGSLEDLVERLERTNRGRSEAIAQALRIEPGDNVLRELIPDDMKERATEFEFVCRSLEKTHPGSLLAKPEVHMVAQDWWVASTRSQCRRFASKVAYWSERAEKAYDALQEYHLGSMGAKVKAALQEDTATEGGNLVPTIVEADITRVIRDAGQIFPRGRQIAMTAKEHRVPAESTAFSVGWAEEEGTLTGTEGTFDQTTLIAEKLYARATMSGEIVEDSAPGLLQFLISVFAERMAGELDYQAVLGDGSGPQITGIRNGSGINALTSGTSAGRDLTWALLASLFAEGGEQSTRNDGIWICSKRGYATLVGLSDSNGMPIVQWGADSQNAPAGTILGRPIVPSNRLSGAGNLDDTTNADTTIIFGPMSHFLAGTRMGMRWEVTDQVNWATFQMDARLVGRFAGNVSAPEAFTYLADINYTA